jgi:hypothetical protein
MRLRKFPLDKFLLLLAILITFQQSCGTHTPPPAKTPESPNLESEKAQSPGSQKQPKPEVAELPPLSARPLKEELPESVLSSPERDLASPQIKYDTVLLTRSAEPPFNAGWQYRINRQKQIVGFEFSNRGGNPILPNRYDINKSLLFTRDFQFRFEDRARQDIYLELTDWAPSRDRQFRLSELMSSVIHFFPRNHLPAVVTLGGRTIVTLPTGEEVEFDPKSHEVLGGVFSEAPVDLNPDKTTRKFPRIDYTGKGVVVRVNSRGTDPRIGTTAVITTGSPAANCEKGTGCNRCQVPSKELWEQKGAVRFRFSTDEEFSRYLLARCGFGLPTIGFNLMITSPVK